MEGSSTASFSDSSLGPTDGGGAHIVWFWWWREDKWWGGDAKLGGGEVRGCGDGEERWEWCKDVAEGEWCGGDVSEWSTGRDDVWVWWWWCDDNGERWCNAGGGVGDVRWGEGGDVACREWGKGGVRVGGRGGVGAGVVTPPEDWASCFAPSRVIGSANVALSSSSSLKIIS